MVLCTLAGPVAADVVVSNDDDPTSTAAPVRDRKSQAQPGAAQVPVAPGVTHDKTIELLLQLQDQPEGQARKKAAKDEPGKRAEERPQGGAASPKVAAQDSAALAGLKQAVMAVSPGAQINTARPAGVEVATERAGPTALGSGESHSTRSRSDGPGLLQLPLIRYIRENRGMVIGISLAVLGAMWLTATLSMRSRGR